MSSFGTRQAKKFVKSLPESKKFDILVYADYNCTTGFGNVTKELISNWKQKIKGKKNLQIVIFAINDQSKEPYKITPNVTVLPANIAPFAVNTDLLQRMAFLTLVQNQSFNLIYILNDLEVAGSFSKDLQIINLQKKKKKQLQFKTVLYFPIDSQPRPGDLNFLETFTEIITYTNYGKDFINDFAPQKVKDKIQVIPHGIDTTIFKKLPSKTILPIKQKLFGKDKFVIGTVNRNSARKDLSTLLLAFSQFKNDLVNVQTLHENVCLYLHCNPQDPAGVNLKMLCSRLDLEIGKDVFFPKDFSENKGYSESQLNELYNCMDVFVTTSTAEGWGLTVTEAMASETLVIAPLHTSLRELCISDKPNAVYIGYEQLEKSVFVGDGNKIRYKTPINILVQKLHYVREINKKQKDVLIKSAKESLINYNWTETADKFWAIIEKYLK